MTKRYKDSLNNASTSDGFSPFEHALLVNLERAGQEGQEIAAFMIENKIHIQHHKTWYPNWFSAWWDSSKHMVFLDQKDFNPQTTNPYDPFLLNTIAHELDHIRFTFQHKRSWIPAGLTKYGEIRGWKIGWVVETNFTGRKPLPGSPIDRLIQLDLDSPHAVRDGSRIINDYLKKVKRGWVYFSFFTLLPSYPQQLNKPGLG